MSIENIAGIMLVLLVLLGGWIAWEYMGDDETTWPDLLPKRTPEQAIVYPHLPDGMIEDYWPPVVGIRSAYGRNLSDASDKNTFRHFLFCGWCGGWLEGRPIKRAEYKWECPRCHKVIFERIEHDHAGRY